MNQINNNANITLNIKEREIILIDNGNDECCINELAG